MAEVSINLKENIRHFQLSAAQRKVKLSCNIKQFKIAALAISRSGQVLSCETNRRIDGNPAKRSFHAEEFLIRSLKNKKIKSKEVYYFIILLIKPNEIRKINPCESCNKILLNYITNCN